MIIWIDASVLDADLASDHDANCGVSGIFDAVYRGEHFALGKRSTLTSLSKNQNLSQTTRRTIETILGNLSVNGSLVDAVKVRAMVTYGQSTVCRRIDSNVMEVPLVHLGVHGVRKTVLLAENIDDARAFEHAGRQYLVSTRMPGQIVLEKSGGGGSTTPDIFRNLASAEHRWCLCVTDSDRLHPLANMDSTAQKCRGISHENSIVASHIDLAAREIENILPFAFITEVIPPTHTDRWNWHATKLNFLRPDVHQYSDIKAGTTLRKILSLDENSQSRTFWEKVAIDLEKAAALSSECIANKQCMQDGNLPCQCHVGHGFGDKVLKLVVEVLDKRTTHVSEKMIRKDENCDEWKNVGLAVYEWCCAPQRTRL